MKNFIDSVSKVVSKFYNLIPGDLKILFFSSFFTLIIAELVNVNNFLQTLIATATPQQLPLILFAGSIVVGLIGYLQKRLANRGTAVLVSEGDIKTIQSVVTKMGDAQDLLSTAPNPPKTN